MGGTNSAGLQNQDSQTLQRLQRLPKLQASFKDGIDRSWDLYSVFGRKGTLWTTSRTAGAALKIKDDECYKRLDEGGYIYS